MNNSTFDNHIKEKLTGYSPGVPPHIWENIMAERDKRKPAGFWLFNRNSILLLAGLLVAGTTAVILYKNNSSSKTTTGSSIVASGENKTDRSITNTTPEKETDQNKTADAVSANSNVKDNDGPGNPAGPATAATNNPKASKNIQAAAGVDQDIISNNKNNISTTTTAKNNTGKTISPGSDRPIVAGAPDKKLRKTKAAAVVSFQNGDIGTNDANDDAMTGNESQEMMMKRMLLNLDMIRAERNMMTVRKAGNTGNFDIPCPDAEKNAAGNKRYFEIYAGPDYAFRSITDTGNSAYLQKRKESTSFSSAFSAGFRYTRVFGNGMSFRTGINYSQINEKFQYAEGNIIQVIYVTDTNGDTTGSYTATGTRYKTTYNKFRTLDVPILIGYELGNGRLHANFNAGAVVNVYSWQKGDVLDTAFKPVNITTGKSTSPYQFKTNVGLGLMGAVSVYYKLNDRWHILAEPYFRYNFSPASKSDLTLKQKYNTAGLRIGVRLDF